VIGTTHAARRLVAALAAVLLAGMLGLGALAGFSGSERRAGGATASAEQNAPGHPRATIAKASTDDHSVSVDLPAGTLDDALSLVTAALVALAVALIAAQIGTAAPVPAGRAPPRR
jgi:D-serine deaminase-like pyridoxal phosphate-dependent protein